MFKFIYLLILKDLVLELKFLNNISIYCLPHEICKQNLKIHMKHELSKGFDELNFFISLERFNLIEFLRMVLVILFANDICIEQI